MSKDFVTVLRLAGRANKMVTRDENGELEKHPGPPISEASASTVYVPDADAMRALLTDISNDPNAVIIPSGYFPGTAPESMEPLAEGTEFCIASKSVIADHLGVNKDDTDKLLGWHEIDGQRHIARLKVNMQPSSWVLLDRDEAKGMPDHLAVLTDEEWLAAMSTMIPGFADAEKVIVPSTTRRVLVDGTPMAASGRHYYLQIQDGSDLGRFGVVLLQRSFLAGYGFMKSSYSGTEPDRVVSNRQWAIFDPTTFSRERISYEGAPTIRGRGLTLAPSKIEVIK